MQQFFHDSNLPLDVFKVTFVTFAALFLFQHVLGHDLHCIQHVRRPVFAKAHLTVAPSTQSVQQDVIINNISFLQPVSGCGGFMYELSGYLRPVPPNVFRFLHLVLYADAGRHRS